MGACKAPAGAGASGAASNVAESPAAPAAAPLDTSWEHDAPKLLAPGDPAPDFEGIAHTGMRVRLSAFLSAPVVVYFYGADKAPGPTSEARGFRDSWLRLSGKVGMVLGVSSDDRISHEDFATEERLPFLLVADERRAIARAFGVPLEGDRNRATTFIVGKDGKVLRVFADVNPERQAEQIVDVVSQ
jgi:peroxiredoxin Q/BCP